MKSKLGFLVLALIFTIPLGGCATKTTPTFTAKYYPDCYDPIDRLCKDQSNKEEVKGAVAGGVIGALGGALVGGLATGKVEGALVGAGVGAVAGAATGYFAAHLNKIKDQEERLAEYQKLLGEKSKGWDLEMASVQKAYQCYGEQISLAQAAYKNKQMTREEFRVRLGEIKAGIEHINTYWADAEKRMDSTMADSDAWLSQQEAEAAAAAQKTGNKTVQRSIKRSIAQTRETKKQYALRKGETNTIKKDVNTQLAQVDRFYKEEESFGFVTSKMLAASL